MAGTLPGVGVGSRRMRHHHHHHHRQGDPLLFRDPPPCLGEHSAAITMPETALIARQRLDRKLAHFRASSRSSNEGANGGRESRQKARTRSSPKSIGSKILGRSPWKLQLNSGRKSEGEMCSVCLEDFEGEQQVVMELSCSHKYHSKCLMPWLASHPHCPTCRDPVRRS